MRAHVKTFKYIIAIVYFRKLKNYYIINLLKNSQVCTTKSLHKRALENAKKFINADYNNFLLKLASLAHI